MLTSLSIKNYALINNLQVDFNNGLTIITGETGAGKSILLGGLSLVLGKRADLSVLKNQDSKCVIEAEFNIEKYNLKSFFKEEDLDYEAITIIRREIAPSGKSRAFVNDTPVTLDVVSRLGGKLIDIHSQHQTLKLTETAFQFEVLDAVANNKQTLENYRQVLSQYNSTKKELEELLNYQKEAAKELDYNSFLLQELQQANLQEGMLEALEATFEKLNNVEEIKEKLAEAYQILDAEPVGILHTIRALQLTLQKLALLNTEFTALHERVQSVTIELEDIFSEIKDAEETTEADPHQLEEVNNKLQLLYSLQKKHNALTVSELIKIQEDLAQKVAVTENLDETIQEKNKALTNLENQLKSLTNQLTENRKKAIPELEEYLKKSLAPLGMPNASFKLNLTEAAQYNTYGKNELTFLFSANKGLPHGPLKKVASGGELSRIMLCIKALLAKHIQLPTIMFDEIDTGVSGEIANKMGEIMQQMGEYMQVFAITHLPQIAAKGHHHFKVFKQDDNAVTETQMKPLSHNERIVEIAQMLDGKNASDAALAHAKGLLTAS